MLPSIFCLVASLNPDVFQVLSRLTDILNASTYIEANDRLCDQKFLHNWYQ